MFLIICWIMFTVTIFAMSWYQERDYMTEER